jgi:DNA polymerase epsilon subunit 1
LFKISVEEGLYVAGESHFSGLINNPNVDGAYELQVPLITRALLAFGTSCALKSGTSGGLSRGLDKGFDLADLERSESNVLRHQYLSGGTGIKYHFLFHATVASRHLIGLFTAGGSAKLYVVDGSRNRQQLPNPSRLYTDRVVKAEHKAFKYPDEMEFVTNYYPSEGGAIRQLVKDLQGLRHGLNVVALCSPFEHGYYIARSAVFQDFPVITFKMQKEEEASLMWLVNTSRRMIGQYLKLSSWIAGQVELAAHYDVPLGVSFSSNISAAAREER